MSLGHDQSEQISLLPGRGWRRRRASRAAGLRSRARSWAALGVDQDGSGAVEMALVLPFGMLLLLGVVQFGGLFFLQNSMTQVANDVVRRIAVGDLSDTAAASEVAARLDSWSATFAVVVDEPTASDTRVTISVPLSDAVLIDLGDWTATGSLSAQAIMRKE